MCSAIATTREHAPPQSFFPDAHRLNLITVPSCSVHNLGNSEDVEYVRNIICGQRGINLAGEAAGATARDSYDRSPGLFARTFGEARKIVIDGEETAAFPIDLPRQRVVMRAVAHALYFHDYGRKWDGGFQVFSPSLVHRDNLYDGNPDPANDFRQLLDSGTYAPMSVSNPEVFQYGIMDLGDGQIMYKFVFYESFVVNAWTRPFKPSPHLYLPICRIDGHMVWTREQD